MDQLPMESHEMQIQFIVSSLSVWAINKGKELGMPKVSRWFERHAKLISIGVSFLTAAGFTWTFEGSAYDGGMVMIGVPGVPALITFLAHAFSGSFGQHFLYTLNKSVEQNREIIGNQNEFKLAASQERPQL